MSLRFSIVLPTFNRRDMLASAMASVRAQNWPAVEIIVVDGGSTDGTLEQVATLPDVALLRGPDRGVYDAFNKGVAHATGDVVGILNSDDSYEPGSFAAATAAFAANPGVDSVCGGAIVVEGERVVAAFDGAADKLMTSPYSLLIGQPMLNARFLRRSAMATVGSFDLGYPYVADRDWLLRWRQRKFTTAAIAHRVYRYRQHAASMTFDPRGPRTAALRADLLALARGWRGNADADRETRDAAALLEGRCRAMLALDALRGGRIGEAARLVATSDGRPSLSPLVSVVRASLDRLRQPIHGGATAKGQ